MSRRARVALCLLAFVFAGAAQMMSAHETSSPESSARHESTLTALSHRQDSAVVPASALMRSGRAIGAWPSVPIAGLLALVALLALWCTASVRRRERLAHAVVTYRRRGPPALSFVN